MQINKRSEKKGGWKTSLVLTCLVMLAVIAHQKHVKSMLKSALESESVRSMGSATTVGKFDEIFFQNLEANAQKKMKERHWFLHSKAGARESKLFRQKAGMTTMQNTILTMLLAPYYPCPWTLQKDPSVEVDWDGGKWTCGLPELAESPSGRKAVIYSFGSANDDAFERTMNATLKGQTEIHVFDPTSEPLKQWNFHQYWMGSVDGERSFNGTKYPMKTLHTIRKELGHVEALDILKFDVEGSEFEMLSNALYFGSNIGQIYFEWHGKDHQKQANVSSLVSIHKLMSNLETAGYRLFSAEPVCFYCQGQWELSWIHKDWRPYN